MVIVSGGLDISVGSATGLCTLVAALAIEATGSAAVAVLAALAAGGAAGCINGLIITLGRVNPVITTLGTMAAFRGLALIISDGRSIGILHDDFRWLGSGFIGFLPVPVFLMLLVGALFFCFMRFTVMGRNVYAMGGNPVVARLAGISLTRYRIAIYTASGVAAGIAGVILAARTGSGQPVSGSEGLELEAITAAILGGCALAGGKGTIFGAVLAVLILGVLKTGMLLVGLQSFYQDVAKGALLIGAVMIQELRFRRSGD
jgi:ribose transport system permease protein/L-arabinose transport system permease protein